MLLLFSARRRPQRGASLAQGGHTMRKLLPLLLTITLALGACAPATASPGAQSGLSGTITLGAVWSLTGGAAIYGPSQQKAADLAVSEINEKKLLGNAQLKLITEDDRSTKEGAQ